MAVVLMTTEHEQSAYTAKANGRHDHYRFIQEIQKYLEIMQALV